MKFDAMFPSKYLRATDLEQPLVVQIRDVSIERLGEAQEPKPVCSFVGDHKPLILNKTNAAALTNITNSDDTDDWAGARVELYREIVLLHGQRTPAVRIRAIREAGDDIPTSWGDEPVTATKKNRQ